MLVCPDAIQYYVNVHVHGGMKTVTWADSTQYNYVIVQGGMKAVIWADAIQFVLILAGLLAVVIQGLVHFNGFTNVWNIAKAGKRINLNSYL